MSRSITCSNNNGSSMIFDTEGFKPFVLASVDGLYQSENNIFVSDNTMIDGSEYQGSVAKKRPVTLTLMDRPDNVYNQDNRDALYILFSKNSDGTLTYEENGKKRIVNYHVEKVYKGKLNSRLVIVSLLCTDPLFYDAEPTIVELANWIGDFEFIHEFTANGEEFGHRSQARVATISNDNAVMDLGMTIIIEALSDVTNPKIVKIDTQEKIQIGSDSYPFNMVIGDSVIITTSVNDKHVYLLRNGVKTEINEYLTEDSKFLQITRGNNSFGYEAKAGVENIIITIEYKRKYEGA